jgi:hypothetical protein
MTDVEKIERTARAVGAAEELKTRSNFWACAEALRRRKEPDVNHPHRIQYKKLVRETFSYGISGTADEST